jgi:hypothetical protein
LFRSTFRKTNFGGSDGGSEPVSSFWWNRALRMLSGRAAGISVSEQLSQFR